MSNISNKFYTVIANQADFVVVSKLPGVAVQGVGEGLSLVNIVKKDLNLTDLFPVHRLDVATSGLLVLAKTTAANQSLSRAFSERNIEKYYLAITHKKTSKKQGAVIGDMEKTRGGSYKLSHSKINPSRTRFFSFGLGEGKRLIVLKPETGKTHQLRVALKSLAAPIIGDERYGGVSSDRMYLHAWQLCFTLNAETYTYSELPSTGEYFLSASFLECVAALGPVQRLFGAKNELE